MLEKELEALCRKMAHEHGGWMPKWTSPGTRGVPDRILFMPGRLVFLEFKQPGKQLTKLQQHYVSKINEYATFNMQVWADVIDSEEKFSETLTAIPATRN